MQQRLVFLLQRGLNLRILMKIDCCLYLPILIRQYSPSQKIDFILSILVYLKVHRLTQSAKSPSAPKFKTWRRQAAPSTDNHNLQASQMCATFPASKLCRHLPYLLQLTSKPTSIRRINSFCCQNLPNYWNIISKDISIFLLL